MTETTLIQERSVDTATPAEKKAILQLCESALRSLPQLLQYFEEKVDAANNEDYDRMYQDFEALFMSAKNMKKKNLTSQLEFLATILKYQGQRNIELALQNPNQEVTTVQRNWETEASIMIYLSIFPLNQAVK